MYNKLTLIVIGIDLESIEVLFWCFCILLHKSLPTLALLLQKLFSNKLATWSGNMVRKVRWWAVRKTLKRLT